VGFVLYILNLCQCHSFIILLLWIMKGGKFLVPTLVYNFKLLVGFVLYILNWWQCPSLIILLLWIMKGGKCLVPTLVYNFKLLCVISVFLLFIAPYFIDCSQLPKKEELGALKSLIDILLAFLFLSFHVTWALWRVWLTQMTFLSTFLERSFKKAEL